MYLPPLNAHTDQTLALAVMREHPFALLVSTGDDNEPFVTHAPLAIDERDSGLVIVGHVARANPHSSLLGLGGTLLAIFSGPHGYVSPSLYASRETVPTWNYVAVHAYGEPRIFTDPAAKDAAQKRLIADHEPAYAAVWRGLDPKYQATMLEGITVFEMPIKRLQAKYKLSQTRPEVDQRAVFEHQRKGTHDEQALARWMQRAGVITPS